MVVVGYALCALAWVPIVWSKFVADPEGFLFLPVLAAWLPLAGLAFAVSLLGLMAAQKRPLLSVLLLWVLLGSSALVWALPEPQYW